MALGRYIYPALETSHRGSWGISFMVMRNDIYICHSICVCDIRRLCLEQMQVMTMLDVSNSRVVDSDGWGSARDDRDSRTVSQVR